MIVKFFCHTCGEIGEVEIDHAAWLIDQAEELCPFCAAIIAQATGELFTNAL